MLLVTGAQINQIYTMADAVAATERAFILYSQRKCDTPLRVCLQVGTHGSTLFMPASTDDKAGVKVVSVRTENRDKGLPVVPATYLDIDGETGVIQGVIDGVVLTYLRTGAVSGVAAKYLARPDSRTLLVCGSGMQGKAAVEAIMCTCPTIQTLRLYDGTIERAQELAEWIKKTYSGRKVEAIAGLATYEEITRRVPEADIIVTVTTSRVPLFDGSAVRPGTFVSCVGAYLPDYREVDTTLISRARVYVDTREGVLNEAGDLIIPITEGAFTADAVVGEIGEVASGMVPSRQTPEEIIVFKTTGSAIQDLTVGHEIYERARAAGVGTSIDM